MSFELSTTTHNPIHNPSAHEQGPRDQSTMSSGDREHAPDSQDDNPGHDSHPHMAKNESHHIVEWDDQKGGESDMGAPPTEPDSASGHLHMSKNESHHIVEEGKGMGGDLENPRHDVLWIVR